ncbi:MAG: hypothetical protein CMF80_00640 [Candidatus Marinimicrobia bacterium]|nr:hypothetical protein [Candidatus Neomarinimicrobiota bacterium]|tara:strand:- start:74 stop:706 length:633 start_codon:yes stop_codon:yes gene_type:complete
MKKKLIIIILMFTLGLSQCDANGDGSLDVIDVVTQVDCILNDCWENLDLSEIILGSWVIDSTHYYYYDNFEQTYCEEMGYYGTKGIVLTFLENGNLLTDEIEPDDCYMDEVSISNNNYYENGGSWLNSYSVDNDSLILSNEFIDFSYSVDINGNNLKLFYQSNINGDSEIFLRRVSILNNIRRFKKNDNLNKYSNASFYDIFTKRIISNK